MRLWIHGHLIFLLIGGAQASVADNSPFHRVPGTEIWEDAATGVRWSDTMAGRFDRERARTECAKFIHDGRSYHLPSAEEFAQLEEHHGRKFLPHMRDSFYWTSTAHGKSSNVRLMFNGNNGTLYWVVYNNISYDSVRCVTNAKK